MKIFREEYLKKLEETVGEMEKGTSGEVVVAVSPRSGNYKDIYLIFAALISFFSLIASLVAAVKAEHEVHFFYIILVPLFSFLAGYFLASKVPSVGRLLISQHRMKKQVAEGAEIAMIEEGVTATRDRTGILIYLSLLERRLVIFTDLGVNGKIPRAEWNFIEHELNQCFASGDYENKLLDLLKKGGDLLRKGLPSDGENVDQIPNRPRIRA